MPQRTETSLMSCYLCDDAAVASTSMKTRTNLFANTLCAVSGQPVSPASSIAFKKHVC